MSVVELRTDFFKFLFGEQEGFICIATQSHSQKDFRQQFFKWPHAEPELFQFLEKNKLSRNVWFCINLLSREERKKETCLPTNLVWADLDDCKPSEIEPLPQIVIESSPDRYQAIWILDEIVDPYIAEDYSRRIYGRYRDNGVDSGWALTKLLRVPFTVNLKYVERPVVNLIQAKPVKLPVEIFDAIAKIPVSAEDVEIAESFPLLDDATSPEEIVEKHAQRLNKHNFHHLYGYEPTKEEDWSKLLWKLYHVCMDAGLSKEEIFIVANSSNFNKFARDGRSLEYLWRDVLKAWNRYQSFEALVSAGSVVMPELVPGYNYDDQELSFVDEYREWGAESTDASPQYHDLTAFMTLSALIGANIKLETTYGTLRPNLWGLILGESSLDRKTTVIRMGLDIVDFIDGDTLLASDASVEGLFTALQPRSRRTSVFYRDEVSGLFSQFQNQKYMSAMPEALAQLYDCPPRLTRSLAKRTITVERPVFLFFGGGIEDRVRMTLDETFVLSGFLPRFLIVSGTTDVDRLRWTGPPTPESLKKRQEIYGKFSVLHQKYTVFQDVEILGQNVQMPSEVDAILTEDSWKLNAEIEKRFVEAGRSSSRSELAYPTFERMARSLLKMSILISATRQDPKDAVIQVSELDILTSARYIQEWGNYTVDLLGGLHRSRLSAILERTLELIRENPGVNRGHVMRMMNLSKREMNEIEGTLDERNQIEIYRYGKGVQYTAIEW